MWVDLIQSVESLEEPKLTFPGVEFLPQDSTLTPAQVASLPCHFILANPYNHGSQFLKKLYIYMYIKYIYIYTFPQKMCNIILY